MLIKQSMDDTNLHSELRRQLGGKKERVATATRTQAQPYHTRGKSIIFGSRNFQNAEKNSTIGSSRPLTPISVKTNNLNPDLVIFEDRADTKLLGQQDGAEKKNVNSNIPSEPNTNRPVDASARRMQFQSMKSSVLLSEKENSVTPEPNAQRGKFDIDLAKLSNRLSPDAEESKKFGPSL